VIEASVKDTAEIQSVVDLIGGPVPAAVKHRRLKVKSKPSMLALTDGPHQAPGETERKRMEDVKSMEEMALTDHVKSMEDALGALRDLAMDDHDEAHIFEVAEQPG
jgi:hypothetical protein